ncbi:hypothetical protein EHRUM3_07290, partial [Ehrlichia ruminantium]
TFLKYKIVCSITAEVLINCIKICLFSYFKVCIIIMYVFVGFINL